MRGRKGFTLLELLIVIVIILALNSMILPRLGGRSEEEKVASAQADIQGNISLSLKLYELDNGRFPTTEQGLQALVSKPKIEPIPSNWNGPYLDKFPIDPWGRPYQYRYPGVHNPSSFDLWSVGKDGIESEDDVKNWK